MALIKGEIYYAVIGMSADLEKAALYAAELAIKHECEIIIVSSISDIPLEHRPRPIINREPIELTLTCDNHKYEPMINSYNSIEKRNSQQGWKNIPRNKR